MSIFIGLIIGVVFTWIGIETWRFNGVVNKVCAAIIIIVAGIAMGFGMLYYKHDGVWKHLDHNQCVQYAWLDEGWRCVTEEQAG